MNRTDNGITQEGGDLMYQMAAYCRLSKDDGENKISESIENQIKIIREYVSRSDDMRIADYYIDDGYSGLYFANRPEFQRMMEDVYKGKIQGIVTKDISRLGREHIETSNYLERVFPALGIRYIAILDGVDSAAHSNEELAQFKTLFNDLYSRDISRKIRGALTVQKKRGQFMSGFAPYGYIKDPADKHHFLIDAEAAKIVRRIFYMYLEGYSKDRIARKLNEEGVLTPSEYKRKVQGLRYYNAQEKTGVKGWAYSTIHVILKNRVYTGAMVQHKSEKISYKMEKYRYIPEIQQYIVDGMHEPVISRDIFEQVQEIMKKRARTPGFISGTGKVNPYAGYLICGECGCNLQRVSGRDGYECASYHRKGKQICSSHFIKRKTIDFIVIDEIQRQAEWIFKGKDKAELLNAADCRESIKLRCEAMECRIGYLREKLADIMKYKMKICEKYMDGILDKEEYFSYKAEYDRQSRRLHDQILCAEQEKNKLEKTGDGSENWIRKFIRSGKLLEMTREIVTELMEKIVVYGDRRMDIIFKYQSPYEKKEDGQEQKGGVL